MRSTPNTLFSAAANARRSADLLLAWIDAAEDAGAAYVAWRDAGKRKRTDAFFAYRAALDREEAAARALEQCALRSPRWPACNEADRPQTNARCRATQSQEQP